jgi:hypothetical protein
MATNGILSRKQLAFMAALMAESSVTKAAEATGIGITTAWRWLRTEAVRQELAERMDAVLAGVCAGLADDAQQARATLRAVMNNPQTPPGVKVRAATAILDAALRLGELVMLAQRVGDLERRMEAQDATHPS